jgi:hypothetical protein
MKVATLLFAAFIAVVLSAPAPEPEVDIKRGLRLAKLIKCAEIEKRQGCFCYKGTPDRRN